jgi:hypothetical protein
VGQAKIPEALLHGLITSGRPIIGAACALFVYAVLQSGLINIIESANVTPAAGLVLGFIAGFSEQFVLNTVSRVAGNRSEDGTTTLANTRTVVTTTKTGEGAGQRDDEEQARSHQTSKRTSTSRSRSRS